jgi:hypothetical protein
MHQRSVETDVIFCASEQARSYRITATNYGCAASMSAYACDQAAEETTRLRRLLLRPRRRRAGLASGHTRAFIRTTMSHEQHAAFRDVAFRADESMQLHARDIVLDNVGED